MSGLSIDINCDMGESFGSFKIGNDEAILPYISSVNIACGFHAGDPAVMHRTVKLALAHGVAIGAHPGLPDLAGFGRREMAVSPEEVYYMLLYQIGALSAFVKAQGSKLHHVKPHGALYNMAARQEPLAEAIVEAVFQLDPSLLLYGLAGSELIKAAEARGLKTAREVFADRTYQLNGSLTSRNQKGSLISQPEEAAMQALRMIKEGRVRTLQGESIAIQADTICIHGDGPEAPAIARQIHELLLQEGILIQTKHSWA